VSDLEHDGIPIINPSELPTGSYDRKQLFLMWADAYGSTKGYVWADHFEDAFEVWIEYLDDACPGCFVTVGEDELKEAADDLGIEWDDQWPEWGDPKFVEVAEHAESDLTTIGHTTLNSGTHIPSDQWGGDDLGSSIAETEVWQVCAEDYFNEHDEYPDPPSHIAKFLPKRGVKFDLDGVTAPSRKLPRWVRPQRRT
jgi:hypothetical protein